MSAIGLACPYGVWVTSFKVDKKSNTVTLIGKAYHSTHILRFLSNLNQQSVFAGTSFILTKIESSSGQKVLESSNQILYVFTLQTVSGKA